MSFIVGRIHRAPRLAPAVLVLIVFTMMATPSAAQRPPTPAEHAVAGDILRVDYASNVIVIQTAAGVGEAIKFTDRTTLAGIKDVTHVAQTAGKHAIDGGAMVVYHTGQGSDRVATRIEHLGKREMKTVKGSVVRVDDAAKVVVIKSERGEETTYDLSKGVAIDSEQGLRAASARASESLKAGTAVTVHYSEEGARKVAHVLRHL